MASYFSETPYCVISEKNMRNSIHTTGKFLATDSQSNKHSSLAAANKSILETQYNDLMDKYLDIDCDDDILFMSPLGDKNTESNFSFQNFPKLLEKKFCLLKPVDSCEISLRENSPSDYFFSRVPIEELFEFTFSKHPQKKYNKIIVKNCLSYFDKHQRYFCEFLNSLLKDTTPYVPCILIIQRVNDLSTLPFHQQVCDFFSSSVCLDYLILSMTAYCQ